MRKILSFLVAAIMLTACGFSKKIDLELNLNEGDSHPVAMKLVTTVEIDENNGSDPIVTTTEVNTDMLMKVVAASEEGYTIEYTMERLSMSLNQPNLDIAESVSFDKGIDSAIEVKMNKKGQITDMKGFQSFNDALINQVEADPNLTADDVIKVKRTLLQSYRREGFTRSVDVYSNMFPDYEVLEDDSWVVTNTISGVKAITTYKYDGVKDGYYVLSGSALIDETSAAKFSQVVKGEIIEAQIDGGSASSTYLLHKNSCWTHSMTMEAKMHGKAIINSEKKNAKKEEKKASDVNITIKVEMVEK